MHAHDCGGTVKACDGWGVYCTYMQLHPTRRTCCACRHLHGSNRTPLSISKGVQRWGCPRKQKKLRQAWWRPRRSRESDGRTRVCDHKGVLERCVCSRARVRWNTHRWKIVHLDTSLAPHLIKKLVWSCEILLGGMDPWIGVQAHHCAQRQRTTQTRVDPWREGVSFASGGRRLSEFADGNTPIRWARAGTWRLALRRGFWRVPQLTVQKEKAIGVPNNRLVPDCPGHWAPLGLSRGRGVYINIASSFGPAFVSYGWSRSPRCSRSVTGAHCWWLCDLCRTRGPPRSVFFWSHGVSAKLEKRHSFSKNSLSGFRDRRSLYHCTSLSVPTRCHRTRPSCCSMEKRVWVPILTSPRCHNTNPMFENQLEKYNGQD